MARAALNAYKMNAAPVKYSVTRLGGGTTEAGVSYPGGLDLTTPSLALQPGALRDMVNFEVSQAGGYARVGGYERLDGRPKPYLATYSILQVTAFTNIPALGDTVTQSGSGATAVVVAINNAAGAYYLVVTKVTGALNSSGNLTVGATPIGTTIPQTAMITPLQTAQYTAAAADSYRADIGAVPGSGDILGVVGMIFNNTDNVYAFRANLGGTAVAIYKATAAGWVLVPYMKIVSFTAGGAAEPIDGETLTQGGVTATIKRVMWQSGAWGGTAVGQFVIDNLAGGNFAGGAATTSGGATVTLSGAETDITMTPGNRFQFVKANFTGSAATRRIYGCDGSNKAFEFDGETLAPISTGASPDTPSNIAFHKDFLFLSLQSSVMYCGAGTPFKWSSTDGGGEIATGDIVTAMNTAPGAQDTAALLIYMRSSTSVLYGTDPATFNFVSFATGTGARQYSAQNLFDAFVFDDLGVINLQTSLNYGNFASSTLTKNILPFIQQERNRLCSSSVNHDKNQYRLYFNDGFGLWLTIVNQIYMGAALVFYPAPVLCSDTADLVLGGSAEYFGSREGYVYQNDVGTSFDGGNIDAYITMAWDPIRTPRILKRFRAASIEMQGSAYAAITFGYQLGYGSDQIGQPANNNYASSFFGAPLWDSFVWDNFVWDGRMLLPTDVPLDGTAENIQVILSTTTNYIAPFNVNSIIYHYTPRRGMRV